MSVKSAKMVFEKQDIEEVGKFDNCNRTKYLGLLVRQK